MIYTAIMSEAGHDDGPLVTPIVAWQQHHLRQVDGSWETFELTDVGKAAVGELRAQATKRTRPPSVTLPDAE